VKIQSPITPPLIREAVRCSCSIQFSATATDLYKYSSRCRTYYSRHIISCSHG